MALSRMPQKPKQSDLDSAQQRDLENPTAQSISSHEDILNLQRTIGNRATIQHLTTPAALSASTSLPRPEAMPPESSSSGGGIQRLIQRAPLISDEEMLAIAPKTTGLFGGAKVTAYNTLVDALGAYWKYANSTKIQRQIRDVNGHPDCISVKLDAVIAAANAWWEKHGASDKASEAAKKAAVAQVRTSANAIKAAIETADAKLIAESASIETMYAAADLWQRINAWSPGIWVLHENIEFYASARTFTTVAQGKAIIAKHLLDRRAGAYPVSPDMVNVTAGVFDEAAALVVRADASLTVADFQALFTKAVKALEGVWRDIAGKIRGDAKQGPGDSFKFQYISHEVPDMTG